MKQTISILIIAAVTLLVATSCEDKYPVMFDDSAVAVGVGTTTLTLLEDGTGSFDIYLAGVEGTAPTDVTLQISVEGIGNPAVEGTDFTLSSKTINVAVGTATVTVNAIDNDEYTGNKQFRIVISGNSRSYPLAAQNSVLVTIVDDEHPLRLLMGTYDVEAESYLLPGDYDETWTVTTTEGPQPGTLRVTGIAFGNMSVIMTVDLEKKTVEIESGQALGEIIPDDGPEDGTIYYATDRIISDVGGLLDPAVLEEAAGIKLTGTFDSDGTIRIDRMAIIIDDWVACWDVYKTVWRKR